MTVRVFQVTIKQQSSSDFTHTGRHRSEE